MQKLATILFCLLSIHFTTSAMEQKAPLSPIEQFKEDARKLNILEFAYLCKMVHRLDYLHHEGIKFLQQSNGYHEDFLEELASENQMIERLAKTSALNNALYENLKSPEYQKQNSEESEEEAIIQRIHIFPILIQRKIETGNYLKVLIALMVNKGLGELSLLDLYQEVDSLRKNGKDFSNIEVVKVDGRTVIRRSIEAN